MTAVRLLFYVVDPFTDEQVAIAALLAEGGKVHLIRGPTSRLPAAAKAAPRLEVLPVGCGAQVVAGEIRALPAGLGDALAWVRDVLLKAP